MHQMNVLVGGEDHNQSYELVPLLFLLGNGINLINQFIHFLHLNVRNTLIQNKVIAKLTTGQSQTYACLQTNQCGVQVDRAQVGDDDMSYKLHWKSKTNQIKLYNKDMNLGSDFPMWKRPQLKATTETGVKKLLVGAYT